MTEIDWTEIRARFADHFDDVQFRVGATTGKKSAPDWKYPPGSKGQMLAYIDARQVGERLDNTVGPEHWHDAYRLVDPATGAVECVLTVHGVPKADVGYPNSANDGADKEPLKASYSDAFKRAAVKWGIGRYLYDMESQWVEIDANGRPLKDPVVRAPQPARQQPPRRETPLPPPAPEPAPTSGPAPVHTCATCDVPITAANVDGRRYTAEQWAEITKRALGNTYCVAHAKDENAKKKANQPAAGATA